MSEIRYELEVEGAGETNAAFENLKIKQLAASDASKRLADELRRLQSSGTASAAEIQRLQREMIRAQQAAQNLGARAGALQRELRGVGDGVRLAQLHVLTQAANQAFSAIARGNPELQQLHNELGQVAAATSAGAQAFGPWGAAVGSLIGVTTVLIGRLREQAEQMERVTTAASRSRGTTIAEQDAGDIAATIALQEQNERAEQLAGGLRSVAEQTEALARARREAAAISSQLGDAELRNEEAQSRLTRTLAEFERASRSGEGASEDLRLAMIRARRDATDTQDAFASMTASLQTTTATVVDLTAALDASRSREAAERQAAASEREMEQAARQREQRARASAQQLAQLQRQTTAEEVRIFGDSRDEMRRLEIDHHRTQIDAFRAFLEERQRLQRAETIWYRQEIQERASIESEVSRAIEEERRILDETDRQRAAVRQQLWENDQQRRMDIAQQQRERASESIQGTKQEAQGVLGPVVSGLTDAVKQLAAGTKTAGEAFQGLLAGFLEMLSQMAALNAAKEFAEAIGAFASQRYDQGALHIAAGVAWTAVAVAAGAASVAVAPPQAQQAPSTPPSDAQQGQRGGDTIINWNSPVVTAGTRAELGREIGVMIDESSRRFGRAA